MNARCPQRRPTLELEQPPAMKNGFIVTSLVLVTGYSGALAAEVVGLLPSGLSVMPVFPVLVAWFAAAGIVAMAVRDYARGPAYDAAAKSRPVEQTTLRAQPAATPEAGWVHRTISA
jgi:hypothetical protein